jgi:long-chain acyl-CoA synthetase
VSLAAKDKSSTEMQRLALADERTTHRWADLDSLLNRFTNALLSHGLSSTQRVGVFAGNSVETAVAYVACLAAGVSAVPINVHLTADELAHILREASVHCLFVGPETASVGLRAGTVSRVPTIVGWRCPASAQVIAFDVFLSAGRATEPPTNLRAQPFLHYTSGTTGKPKAVASPPKILPTVGTTEQLFAEFRKDVCSAPSGSTLIVGPLYHTGPLRMLRLLGGGGTVVTMDRFDAERVLENIERYSIARSMMVPTHFQRLLALPEAVKRKFDLSSLRYVSHTGSACPINVKLRMIEWWGPILFEAYGATESGAITMISSVEWMNKQGSVGRPLAPFEAMVLSEDGGQLLGPKEIGHLYFRDTSGRGIAYYSGSGNPASLRSQPGIFTLGEMGYLDEDGYVFITDRAADMIVSGGVNIYPAEIEAVLVDHPEVEDIAVIGVPSTDMGEEVKALIVPKNPDCPPSPDALNHLCRSRLAGYKCPRSYEFVADLNRTPLGKLNKRVLRKPYWPTSRTIG